MTVETAVAIAGGYTPRAFKRRIEISHQVGGLTEKRVVSPNYPVQPGDTVHIAERWF
jgi:polysaccharide export outer membrane protein